MRSEFVEELREELKITAPRVYPRYSGDFDTYSRGSGYGARGYGGYSSGGYSSAPKRVGRASEYSDDDSGFIFGAAKKPASTAPTASSAPTGNPSSVRFGNIGTKPAQTQTQSKDTSRFSVGMTVKHPRFGVGVITAMRGAANNLIITVKFEVAGNKDLAAALAPLEIIN